MRIFGRVVITALCVAGLIGAGAIPTFADEKGNLTDFSSMTAISVGGLVVRGLPGGGGPWAITSGTATASQHDEGDVHGQRPVVPSSGGIDPITGPEAPARCLHPQRGVNGT